MSDLDVTDLTDIVDEIHAELRKHRPVFPAPGVRVYVASTQKDDPEFMCAEYPVIGWRACGDDDCLEPLCLHIWSSRDEQLRPICWLRNISNVIAVRVIYGNEFDLEVWKDRQHNKFLDSKPVAR